MKITKDMATKKTKAEKPLDINPSIDDVIVMGKRRLSGENPTLRDVEPPQFMTDDQRLYYTSTAYDMTTASGGDLYREYIKERNKKAEIAGVRFSGDKDYEDEERLLSPEHISSGKKYYHREHDPIEDLEENEEERMDRELREEEEYRRSKKIDTLFEEVFKEYDETGDIFILFKLLFDTNLISLGSALFSSDWRRNYPTIEIAREGYLPKAISIVDHIKGSAKAYFGYTISERHLDVVRGMILDIYLTSPDKLVMISIDTEEILSDLIRSCRARDIKIHNSIKDVKNINFAEYRRNSLQITLSYISTFNTLFLSNARQHSITTRTGLSKFYMALEHDRPIVRYYANQYGEDIININGVDYSKKVFESILELNFEEFMTNMRLETLLEKDIADESVAGTGELKSI